MHRLVAGVHHFQSNIFRSDREFFEKLTAGQRPEALFITCSDSRINPNLITQTRPGELFILRNAGNIVPPHGAACSGEAATVEFALVELKIHDIIVCGHSHCGAVKAILNPEAIRDAMPIVYSWLQNAESTRRIMRNKYEDLSEADLWNVAVQENVLVQIENLRTHPAVALGLSRGELKLHGWVYKMETGQIFAFSPDTGQFLPLDQEIAAQLAPGAILQNARAI